MHTPAFSAADYDKKIRQTVPFYDAYFAQAAGRPCRGGSKSLSAGWI